METDGAPRGGQAATGGSPFASPRPGTRTGATTTTTTTATTTTPTDMVSILGFLRALQASTRTGADAAKKTQNLSHEATNETAPYRNHTKYFFFFFFSFFSFFSFFFERKKNPHLITRVRHDKKKSTHTHTHSHTQPISGVGLFSWCVRTFEKKGTKKKENETIWMWKRGPHSSRAARQHPTPSQREYRRHFSLSLSLSLSVCVCVCVCVCVEAFCLVFLSSTQRRRSFHGGAAAESTPFSALDERHRRTEAVSIVIIVDKTKPNKEAHPNFPSRAQTRWTKKNQ